MPLRPLPQPTEVTPDDAVLAAENRIGEIGALITALDEGTEPECPVLSSKLACSIQENQLVQVRLGVASSLFATLRWKHEHTARHCLRVALACSNWAVKMNLPTATRDELELAALLHDIGKIGVPDSILAKPAPLSPQEAAVMESHWLMGREVLRSSCVSPEILDIMTYARAWFDGSKHTPDHHGEDLPLGARMLSIADAFDSMTSDHVYRHAMPREVAFHELYRFAGTQFDPKLVDLFREMHECDQVKLQANVARRWLHDLDPDLVGAYWKLNEGPRPAAAPDLLFPRKLLENMYDGVIFVDSNLRVQLWNRGIERLTGITSESIHQRRLAPSLLDMQDEDGRVLADSECPVTLAIRTGVQWLRRLNIRSRSGKPIAVDAHAIPVVADDGVCHGLTLLVHDASSEISLEARCQSLHARATQDPLTQVANRAEFDRVHELFVAAHLESRRPCSLIISDIDRFKRVNDTYGHQAGDQVIQGFARILKQSCRQGDLVARYGGEEFVILCADCDNSEAVRRAEDLRKAFSQAPHDLLEGKCVTASFGVTEAQPGDTPETMLRRADRALLNAKEGGRNMVVQLGSGAAQENEEGLFGQSGRRRPGAQNGLIEQRLVSIAPLYVSIEKLRGFIADHKAQIVCQEEGFIQLRINDVQTNQSQRRRSDRPIRFLMDIGLEEENCVSQREQVKGGLIRTNIRVAVRPERGRERRQADTLERARRLIISVKSYLMATAVEDAIETPDEQPLPTRGLLTWFRRGS